MGRSQIQFDSVTSTNNFILNKLVYMPKKLKKESKEYQYNLARQQFLNLNGIKVKLDGSWKRA